MREKGLGFAVSKREESTLKNTQFRLYLQSILCLLFTVCVGCNQIRSTQFQVIRPYLLVNKNQKQLLQLREPKGICVAKDGSLFLSDTSQGRVLHMLPTGQVLHEIKEGQVNSKNGTPPISIKFIEPMGICSDGADGAYVTDWGHDAVFHINGSGKSELVFSKKSVPKELLLEPQSRVVPMDCAFSPKGVLWVADPSQKSIWKIHLQKVTRFAGGGLDSAKVGMDGHRIRFQRIASVCALSNGGLAVQDMDMYHTIFLDERGKVTSILKDNEITDTTGAVLNNLVIGDLDSDSSGQLWMLESTRPMLMRLSQDHKVQATFELPRRGFSPPNDTPDNFPRFGMPWGVCVGQSGDVWVTDIMTNALYVYRASQTENESTILSGSRN